MSQFDDALFVQQSSLLFGLLFVLIYFTCTLWLMENGYRYSNHIYQLVNVTICPSLCVDGRVTSKKDRNEERKQQLTSSRQKNENE